jgi:hypothetical protein
MPEWRRRVVEGLEVIEDRRFLEQIAFHAQAPVLCTQRSQFLTLKGRETVLPPASVNIRLTDPVP